MNERTRILQELINYRGDLSRIIMALKAFPWDSDKELVKLKMGNIASVLQRYVNSELTSSDIEDWANIIEGREDIGYEETEASALKTVLHELANPLLTQTLTVPNAQKLLHNLLN